MANDVCRILGYSNLRDAVSKHCNPKGVVKRDALTRGGMQKMTFITEGNIYRLVAKSRNPEAAAFEEWVFDEVLPAIRKTGKYEMPEAKNGNEKISCLPAVGKFFFAQKHCTFKKPFVALPLRN